MYYRSVYDIIETSSYAFELSLSLTYLPRARPGQPAQSLSPAPGPRARWLHPSVRSPCIYPVMQPPCPALSMLCRARASSCAINATVCDFRSIDLSLPPPTPPHLSALSSPPPSWPAPPRVPSSFASPFAQALCSLLQPSLPLPACCQPAAAVASSTPRLFSCWELESWSAEVCPEYVLPGSMLVRRACAVSSQRLLSWCN